MSKPVWTNKHDKIIEEYKDQVKNGSIREIVLIPRDDWS